jgi:hypothetical protein
VIARHRELLGPADRRSRGGGGRRLAADARSPHRPRRSSRRRARQAVKRSKSER